MSLVEIRVIPRAKHNNVVVNDGRLTVRVTAPPDGGKANTAVVRLLADHWKVPVSSLEIVRGEAARRKTIRRP